MERNMNNDTGKDGGSSAAGGGKSINSGDESGGGNKKRKLPATDGADDGSNAFRDKIVNQVLEDCRRYLPSRAVIAKDIVQGLYKELEHIPPESKLPTNWIDKAVKKIVDDYSMKLDEQLQKINQRLREKSVDRLIELYDKNTESLLGQRQNFHLSAAMGAAASSDMYPNQEDAICSKKQFIVSTISHLSVEANEASPGAEYDPIPSVILSMEPWPLEYDNRASVLYFVTNMLWDVVSYANYVLNAKCSEAKGIRLFVTQDASLFSNEPDQLFVRNNGSSSRLSPLLVVKVKAPHKPVFRDNTGAEEMFDNLMATQVFYGKPSFGILTTFNESKVVWCAQCDEEASCADRMSAQSLETLALSLSKFALGSNTVKHLEENTSRIATSNESENETGEPQLKSPPRQVAHGSEASSSPCPLTRPVNQDGTLRYSEETYKAHQLFTVLCNALVASLKMGGKTLQICGEWEESGILEQGTPLLMLRRTSIESHPIGGEKTQKDYEWKTLESSFCMAGQWIIDDKQACFYLMSFLGAGRTSRVWRALVLDEVNKKGYGCVIKLWIKVADIEDDFDVSEQSIEDESAAAAETEVANYKAIYDDLFFLEEKTMVGRARLNHRWCVIVPFFKPLEKSERNESMLERIEKVLKERFYDQTKCVSYQFTESDCSWRHVGMWNNNEVILFDLAGLEKVEHTEPHVHDAYVKNHLEELRDNMPAGTKETS